MPPVGFEATVSAGERPQTYALDRAANGNGTVGVSGPINTKIKLANYLTWPYTIDRNLSPYYFSIQPNRFAHPDISTFHRNFGIFQHDRNPKEYHHTISKRHEPLRSFAQLAM
jgi:hypothetical protein